MKTGDDNPSDGHGPPAIVAGALAEAKRSGQPLRLAVEVPAEVDKDEMLLLGVLPLVAAEAARVGRTIVWLYPDGRSQARASMRAINLVVLSRPQIGTWDALSPMPENNFQSTSLEKLWIIGDLDWSANPLTSRHGEAVVAAVKRVLRTGNCPALLVHQQGKTPVVPYPPRFQTGSSRCFIATAVCGGDAPEVEQLQHFRDTVMRRRAAGRRLIALYERMSPPLAARIRGRRRLCGLLRRTVIGPLAAFARAWSRRNRHC
jgi:hypothetical protein